MDKDIVLCFCIFGILVVIFMLGVIRGICVADAQWTREGFRKLFYIKKVKKTSKKE